MALAHKIERPTLFLFKKLFPTWFDKTDAHGFYHEVYEFAKHHHMPFSITNGRKGSF